MRESPGAILIIDRHARMVTSNFKGITGDEIMDHVMETVRLCVEEGAIPMHTPPEAEEVSHETK